MDIQEFGCITSTHWQELRLHILFMLFSEYTFIFLLSISVRFVLYLVYGEGN